MAEIFRPHVRQLCAGFQPQAGNLSIIEIFGQFLIFQAAEPLDLRPLFFDIALVFERDAHALPHILRRNFGKQRKTCSASTSGRRMRSASFIVRLISNPVFSKICAGEAEVSASFA